MNRDDRKVAAFAKNSHANLRTQLFQRFLANTGYFQKLLHRLECAVFRPVSMMASALTSPIPLRVISSSRVAVFKLIGPDRCCPVTAALDGPDRVSGC